MKTNIFLTSVLVILLIQGVSAQWRPGKSSAAITQWEIGLSGGISTFITSINPDPGAPDGSVNYWKSDVNPGFGLSVVRNISPALGIEMNFLNTRLTGKWNDSYPMLPISARHELPLTFNTQINQIDLMAAFNLNQMMLPGDEEDLWHLFFKTGIGVAHVKDTKRFYSGEKYTRMSLVLDAGLSVSISDKVKLMIGSAFRSVNTDNLDGVHVESTDLSGSTASWMKVYEIYNFTYLRVSYCLDNSGSKGYRNTFKKRKQNYRNFRRN